VVPRRGFTAEEEDEIVDEVPPDEVGRPSTRVVSSGGGRAARSAARGLAEGDDDPVEELVAGAAVADREGSHALKGEEDWFEKGDALPLPGWAMRRPSSSQVARQPSARRASRGGGGGGGGAVEEEEGADAYDDDLDDEETAAAAAAAGAVGDGGDGIDDYVRAAHTYSDAKVCES
jgi:hypothetical protein